MNLPVNLAIARVHLLSRKKQTIIAMLGVTFGIAMFVLMISFMEGVNEFLDDIAMSATAHIHIYNDFKTDYSSSVTSRYFGGGPRNWVIVRHPRPKQIQLKLKNAPGIVADLRRYNDVVAVSPLVSEHILFNYGPVQLGVVTDGVDIREEDKLFGLSGKMDRGSPGGLLNTANGLLIGYQLADKLQVTIGDLVTATAPSGAQMRFKIVGIYRFGMAIMDQFKAYVSTSSMQQLLGKNRDYITDIRIRLRDFSRARGLARVIAKKYGYKAEDWETVNASFEAGDNIRNTLTYVVSLTLLVVAGFGIYNIMNMTIANKMKDIAILKAQGFDRKDILQIFLSQSLFIGILGGLIGLSLGFLCAWLLSQVPFPHDDYILIKYYPVAFKTRYYLFGAAFGVLTTVVAGWMPALKASKVDPVSILRS